MDNKEIITEIIEDLENTVGLNWIKRKCKIDKNKLIECWSQGEIEDYIYYGYKYSGSMAKIYSKIFSNIIKEKHIIWKMFILNKYGYKYCKKCNNLYKLDNFSTDITRSDNKQVYCKPCNNKNTRNHYFNNKEKYMAKGAKRRAAKFERVPKWITEKDLKEIENFYILAKSLEKETGIKYHVDHIIPLQGKLVSGLHVPSNLRVITMESNLSKSNKYLV